jgi:hypothetical protein
MRLVETQRAIVTVNPAQVTFLTEQLTLTLYVGSSQHTEKVDVLLFYNHN